MRKPYFCQCENKGVDQTRAYVFAECRTLDDSDLCQFGPFLWSIRTLDDSDLSKFGPLDFGQIGPQPVVNSDLILWSVRTSTIGQFGP